MVGECAVGAVFRKLRKQIVVTVFIRLTSDVQITVFVITTVIAIVAVFTVHNVDTETWHREHQLMPLFEKRTVEINISSIIQRIPVISIPFVRMENRERSILRIQRYHCFATLTAWSTVERTIVAPAHTTLVSADRTE
jgi:hypothetical protein